MVVRNTAQGFCIGMSTQMGRMSQWTRDKLTAFYTQLTEFFRQARQLISDLGSICRDPSTECRMPSTYPWSIVTSFLFEWTCQCRNLVWYSSQPNRLCHNNTLNLHGHCNKILICKYQTNMGVNCLV